MEKVKITSYFLLLLLPLACGRNQEKPKTEKINDLVQEAFEDKEFIGNVLVADQEKIVYQKSFGKSDQKNSVQNADTTKFLIASISKPITAILILRLADKGILTLDDPINKYFTQGDLQVGKVTLHQLLTHTSGINELINKEENMSIASLIKHATLNFEPGSDFEYSNSGYVILKEIAQIATQRPYTDLVATEIFLPADMTQSGIARSASLRNIANGYQDASQEQVVDLDFPIENVDGAGSIYSTVADLYKLDRALYTESILSKAMKEKMLHQHVPEKFSYGWFVRERSGVWDVYWQKGDLPGFTSFISRSIKKEQCIILLSNMENAELSDLENSIAKILKTEK